MMQKEEEMYHSVKEEEGKSKCNWRNVEWLKQKIHKTVVEIDEEYRCKRSVIWLHKENCV